VLVHPDFFNLPTSSSIQLRVRVIAFLSDFRQTVPRGAALHDTSIA